MAAAECNCSRNTNFWILPVEVLGNTPKMTCLGTLNRAISARQCAMISASDAVAPTRSSTKAAATSPHFSSGLATTAAASTEAWRYNTSSTSTLEMFSPPEMITSLLRSLILT
jgi:hypothetical protein